MLGMGYDRPGGGRHGSGFDAVDGGRDIEQNAVAVDMGGEHADADGRLAVGKRHGEIALEAGAFRRIEMSG